MSGFIKIHRKLIDWGWYSVPCVKDVFLHLLLTANYSRSEYRGTTIERGQAVFGISSLSEKLGYSVQQIRTAIGKLKSTGEISVSTNHHFSVATISNYDSYQTDFFQADNKQITNNQQTNNKQITNKQQTDNKQITPSKKNKKERREEIYIYVLDAFNQICHDLPKIKTLNETRKRRIDKADEIVKAVGNGTFDDLFTKIQASDFLTGKVKDWRADFDWIMKPENLQKILEGVYDNRAKGGIYSAEGASFDVSRYENSGLFDD